MSSSLAVVPDESLFAMQKASGFDDDTLAEVGGSGLDVFPRLQLFGSNSNEVKESKIGVAHYGIIRFGEEKIQDLGLTTLAAPIGFRPLAAFLKGDKPKFYYNKESEVFKDFKAKADADSQSGYCYGPQFLVWVNGVGFATFFFSSKTMRNMARLFNSYCPTPSDPRFKVALCGAKLIDNGQYKWHGPTFSLSEQTIDLPALDTIKGTFDLFLKPEDSPVDKPADPNAVNADR